MRENGSQNFKSSIINHKGRLKRTKPEKREALMIFQKLICPDLVNLTRMDRVSEFMINFKIKKSLDQRRSRGEKGKKVKYIGT